MRHLSALHLVLALLFLFAETAEAASRLDKITRTDERERLQLHATFSSLPGHDLLRSGRRIDLLCSKTVAAPDLILPGEDEHIVKILVRPEGNDLVVSLFFRYEPREVRVAAQEPSARLMLDVLLGNQYSQAFPDLASQLQGLSLAPPDGRDSTNPLNLSRYQQDWRLLFERLETPLVLHPPPGYTLPPFPMALLDRPSQLRTLSLLPPAMLEMGAKRDWQGVMGDLRDRLQAGVQDNDTERLLLTALAETLLRDGKLPECNQVLEQLRHQPLTPAESVWVAYLQAQVLARVNEPHLARIELDGIDESQASGHPLTPYLNLLAAEISLATSQLDLAEEELNADDAAYTGIALHMRRLRRADISYLRGEQVRAYAAYMRLGQQRELLGQYPLSLAGYADALYQQHQYPEAARAYQELANLLIDDPGWGLAVFRLALSEQHSGEQRKARRMLEQILDGSAGSEAHDRARIKIADLELLAGAVDLRQLISRYGELAEHAVTTALREEAHLKQAIVFHLLGARDKAVELAMRHLKDFRHGRLRIEAQALLLQDLPEVLRGKVQAEEYIDALVLARQNRDLFARRWIDLSVLDENATAYLKLGFPDRAIKVLQYLMDASPAHQTEERYRKLVAILVETGRYDMAEDYADRYMFRYPQGSELATIFLLRLQALRLGDRPREALALLMRDQRPQRRDIDRYGAEIMFLLEHYEDAALLLDSLQPPLDEADTAGRFYLAESLFQAKRPAEAIGRFASLYDDEKYGDQARYRTSQILLDQGKRDEAVKLLQQLTDKAQNTLWQRLAREELRMLQKTIR